LERQIRMVFSALPKIVSELVYMCRGISVGFFYK